MDPTAFFLNYSLNCYILFDPGCLLETETSSRAGAHILDLPCVLNKIQLPGVPNVFVHQAGASFFFSSGFCLRPLRIPLPLYFGQFDQVPKQYPYSNSARSGPEVGRPPPSRTAVR